eukprot:306139-Pelagomonas_calceolata.AAC.1
MKGPVLSNTTLCANHAAKGCANSLFRQHKRLQEQQKKERLRLPSAAACIKEMSPVLKGRAPSHRLRESKHRSLF